MLIVCPHCGEFYGDVYIKIMKEWHGFFDIKKIPFKVVKSMKFDEKSELINICKKYNIIYSCCIGNIMTSLIPNKVVD